MNEKTRSILELIKERREIVLRRYMEAVRDRDGQKGYIASWEHEHRNDGPGPGFGRPNMGNRVERVDTAKADLRYIDSVYDYAVETFVGD